jgi:UDP:flavonoid glycosyltransferase YjiC (YdhE family)
MPRRIVIACWGSFGDVYPYVGLAKALKARGHRPIVAAPAYYRPTVEQEAIDFAAVGPDIDPNDRAAIAAVMHPVKGTETVVRDFVVSALRQTYEETRGAVDGADLIVSHPLTFTAPMLAEQRGVPWVSTLLAPLGFFSTTDFPVLPPAPWLVHFRGLGSWFGRILVGLARRATRDWMEPVYRLRAELGLPRGGHPLFEGQFSPSLTLALFSRVLAEPQPDWPPHVRTTGFVFYNGPAALDATLSSFLDESKGAPPIVFTLGSSAVGAAGRFYHESVDAVARLGVRAVLLTGGYTENLPPDLPPSVLLVDRAPHQLLFPRASAVVHQGGIGTTAQALRSGHPMLVVPHAHDQPDNAFRVTNLGVARTIFPRRYKAGRVALELERLLGEGRFRERSTAVAAQVKQEGGADAAAEAIEELIGR